MESALDDVAGILRQAPRHRLPIHSIDDDYRALDDVASNMRQALSLGLPVLAVREAVLLVRAGTVAEEGWPGGRGLHSLTSQLNLSSIWSLKPKQASTSQLNLRRLCRCNLGT